MSTLFYLNRNYGAKDIPIKRRKKSIVLYAMREIPTFIFYYPRLLVSQHGFRQDTIYIDDM